jgi:hypothetical protein
MENTYTHTRRDRFSTLLVDAQRRSRTVSTLEPTPIFSPFLLQQQQKTGHATCDPISLMSDAIQVPCFRLVVLHSSSEVLYNPM